MPSDTAGGAARRHDAGRYVAAFRYRSDEVLPLDPREAPLLPLLLDTTYYLDRSAGRVPPAILALIAERPHLVHTSATTCAELAVSIGLLDPRDARTPATAAAIQMHLDRMALDTTVSPGPASWTEAAVLAGILARTQGLAMSKRGLTPDQECCQRGRRRELLLDALLYLTAIEHGLLLVSGNLRHMDLLLQIRPSRNVLLYRPAGAARGEARSSGG